MPAVIASPLKSAAGQPAFRGTFKPPGELRPEERAACRKVLDRIETLVLAKHGIQRPGKGAEAAAPPAKAAGEPTPQQGTPEALPSSEVVAQSSDDTQSSDETHSPDTTPSPDTEPTPSIAHSPDSAQSPD